MCSAATAIRYVTIARMALRHSNQRKRRIKNSRRLGACCAPSFFVERHRHLQLRLLIARKTMKEPLTEANLNDNDNDNGLSNVKERQTSLLSTKRMCVCTAFSFSISRVHVQLFCFYVLTIPFPPKCAHYAPFPGILTTKNNLHICRRGKVGVLGESPGPYNSL